MSGVEIIRGTLRGLQQRRRWLPIVCLCLPVCAFALWYERQWESALISLMMSLCLPVVAPITWRWLFSQSRGHFELRLLAYIAAGIGCVALLGGLAPKLMGVGLIFISDPSTLFLTTLIFWVGGWTLGRDIDLEQHLTKAIAYGERKALQAEHAQLLAIRRHLDPHFLYNTLNAIAEWCQQDPAVAEEGILQLSHMLRVLLDGIEQPTWPLSQELTLVQRLLDLYKLRDPERLQSELALPPNDKGLASWPIPPMLLLSLVENAIKHGPWAGHRGTIIIDASRVGDRLQLDVSNPGPYLPQAPQGDEEAATGRGLVLLRKRLLLLYGERATCRLWEEDGRTHARLELPASPSFTDAQEAPQEREATP